MDSAVSTAARALASGDPLLALKHVALRDDAPALALRGIAMAQLGDFAVARRLLIRAERSFGTGEPLARARCALAVAEVSLAARELGAVSRALEGAARTLAAHGDRENALFAGLVGVRQLVLTGQVAEGERTLAALSLSDAPARLVAVAELLAADLAVRRVRAGAAYGALARGAAAARAARIPALLQEVERARRELEAPAARLVSAGGERAVSLAEVESLLARDDLLLVDGCRRELRSGASRLSLVKRPVLFALALALAERGASGCPRGALIERVFSVRRANDSHRARLRVEVGRLRQALRELAELSATADGYVLLPRSGRELRVLLPPTEDEASALRALLAGGEAWSTSALAAALGQSQRTVQRALLALQEEGRLRSVGKGRARRWVSPPSTGFATTLLLVARGAVG